MKVIAGSLLLRRQVGHQLSMWASAGERRRRRLIDPDRQGGVLLPETSGEKGEAATPSVPSSCLRTALAPRNKRGIEERLRAGMLECALSA